MSDVTKAPNGLQRLYRGLTTIDFVGRRRLSFTLSIVIIVVGLGSLSIRGFNLGIDFKGGDSWEVLAPNTSITTMSHAVENARLVYPTHRKAWIGHLRSDGGPQQPLGGESS